MAKEPFTKISNYIIECDLLDIFEKVMYICLKMFAYNTNQCTPSIDVLTGTLHISKHTVRKAINGLVEKKFLIKENRKLENNGDLSNLYTLLYDEIAKKEGISELTAEPFTNIFNYIIKSDLLNITEKMMYICLKMFAFNTNKCFPSNATLVNTLGISEPTVIKTIKGLEEKKFIIKQARISAKNKKTSNMYTLFDRPYDELKNSKKKESSE